MAGLEWRKPDGTTTVLPGPTMRDLDVKDRSWVKLAKVSGGSGRRCCRGAQRTETSDSPRYIASHFFLR